MRATKRTGAVFLLVLGLGLAVWAHAVEAKRYRLLSITNTTKLILVSEIPSKTKYVLDAATAKITVDGKPTEFQDLKAYAVIRVTFDARKSAKDGIDIDGVAKEISISTPDNPK